MRTDSSFASDIRFLGKATLGLMIAWVLNWLFFDVDNRHVQHALTRNFYYSTISEYSVAHISYRVQLCYEYSCHWLDPVWCSASPSCLKLGLQRLKSRRSHRRVCRQFGQPSSHLHPMVLFVWASDRSASDGHPFHDNLNLILRLSPAAPQTGTSPGSDPQTLAGILSVSDIVFMGAIAIGRRGTRLTQVSVCHYRDGISLSLY